MIREEGLKISTGFMIDSNESIVTQSKLVIVSKQAI